MQIDKLSWDSDFFGYPVGRLQIADLEELDNDHFIKMAQPFQLVYVFSSVPLAVNFLKHVDTKTTLSQSLSNTFKTRQDDPHLCSFMEEIHPYEDLERLALESGIYSRFKVDTNFALNEYERLYTKWIENSVKNKKAFNTGIYFKDKKLLGFTTVEEKTTALADIGLVAVDPVARGKGIGTLLIEDAKKKAYERSFKKIQVVTQAANVSAIALYERCNFNIEEQKYIYHYWNK